MEIKTEEITSLLKQQLDDYKIDIDISEVGEVINVGDGVARVSGLRNVMSSELVELPNDVFGMALNLEEDNVGIVLFGDARHVKEGDLAKRTGKVLEVPVGEELLGRVVNPLGQPIDGKVRSILNIHCMLRGKLWVLCNVNLSQSLFKRVLKRLIV